MIYLVNVHRRLNLPAKPCDIAYVSAVEDDSATTDRLGYQPPTQDNVSYYAGTFASLKAALAAVKRDFPLASIDMRNADA